MGEIAGEGELHTPRPKVADVGGRAPNSKNERSALEESPGHEIIRALPREARPLRVVAGDGWG